MSRRKHDQISASELFPELSITDSDLDPAQTLRFATILASRAREPVHQEYSAQGYDPRPTDEKWHHSH